MDVRTTTIRSRIFAILLAAAMILTMTPYLDWLADNPYAATSAPGGEVESNDDAALGAALGGGDCVGITKSTTGGTVITATLKTDITLQSPLTLKRVTSGDKTIIKLNNHSITAASGTDGTDADAAKGKNAIEIASADFDVVIQGPGSVTGGKGAVYETESKNRYGTDGGMAVCLTDYGINDNNAGKRVYWFPESPPYKLEHGLTVTGGATLTGGEGGSVSGSDLMYNIEKYEGERWANAPTLLAGDGGAGIGQYVTRRTSEAPTIAYSRIEIDKGVVNGGQGGGIDLSGITPTDYAIMNSAAAGTAMQGKTNSNYGDRVGSMLKQRTGAGGDGIMTGAGRKYLYVGQNSAVNGGTNGTPEFGSNKYVAQMYVNISDAGSGISINAGDMGLTNEAVSWSSHAADSKDKDSDDVGIFIEGAVTGGNSADADALGEDAGAAGTGLFMNGDGAFYEIDNGKFDSHDYAWDKKLGVVAIANGGSVAGGKGGDAAYGSAGRGGDGLEEYYKRNADDGPATGQYGTDYYILNGTVSGGNGGDSMRGFAGTGGTGYTTSQYRDLVNITGSGSLKGGDGGTEVIIDGGTGSEDYTPEAAYFYPSQLSNVVSVSKTNGGKVKAVTKSTFNVTVSMTAFSTNPDASTKVSCTVDKPTGYSGGMYIVWTAVIHESSEGSNNGKEVLKLESAGTDYTSFNLLTNSAYKYLSYPMYDESYGLNMNHYNADVATVDRMAEDHKIKTDVYCTVVLEDGRWGRSNVMTFEKGKGWDGGGSGGQQGGQESDEEAVNRVAAMIDAIPSLSVIGSEDKNQINAARAAYNALSESRKALFNSIYPSALSDLEAAEAKLNEIIGEETLKNEAYAVREKIKALPDPASITEKDNMKVVEADDAYEELSNYQKEKYIPECYASKLKAAFAALGAIVSSDDNELAEKIAGMLDGLEEDINSRDEAVIVLGDEETIKAAEAAYNNLTDKSLVDDATKVRLDNAVQTIDQLKAEDAIAQINSVDLTQVGENSDAAQDAVDAYELLSDKQKAIVNDEEGAADKIEAVKGAIDQAAADKVTASINSLPLLSNITLDNEAAVSAAKAKYDSLTDAQKALVPEEVKNALNNASAKIDTLKEEQSSGQNGGQNGGQNSGGTSGGQSTGTGGGQTTQPAAKPAAPSPAEVKDLPAVKISTPKAGKKKVTVKWKKVSKKNQKKIQGIEIRIVGPNYNKTFKAGKTKTSKTIKKLKSKKKYTISIRAYKWVGNVKHVSAWKSKKVKIK